MNFDSDPKAQREVLPVDMLMEGLKNVFANKYKLILLSVSAGVAAYFLSGLLPERYASTVTLSINGAIDGKASWQDASEEALLNKPFLNTQYEILTSRDLAERVAHNPDATDCTQAEGKEPSSSASLVFDLMRNVEVSPVRNTPLFRITAKCSSGASAKATAELFATEFISSKYSDFNTDKEDVTQWMSSRMNELKEKLIAAEADLQDFKETQAVYSSSMGGAIEEVRISQLLNAYSSEQEKLAGLRAVHEQIQALGDDYQMDELMTISSIREDRIVSQLLAELAGVKARYEGSLELYTKDHPSINSEKVEYEQLQRQLQAQVHMVSQGIAKQLSASTAAIANLERDIELTKSESIALDRKKSELSRLEQNVEINRELYRNFMERVNDLVHAQGYMGEQIKIVGKAYEPSQPFAPNEKLNAALAFAATFALIFFFYLIRGLRDSTLKAPTDVELKLSAILLGYLPNVKSNDSALAYDGYSNTSSVFSEGVRSIRTSLSLLNMRQKGKVTVVTSSVPNEGKSTVAVNLAASFGQIEKVLLIDADIRRPTLVNTLGMHESSQGLMNVLINERSINECIYKNHKGKYDFMPAGWLSATFLNNPGSPKDPFELLSLEDYRGLLDLLRGQYDHIIVDSPPVCGISDARVLAANSTSVVYVVAAFQTHSRLIKRGLNELKAVNANIAGIVLNKVNIEKMRQYDYEGYYTSYDPA